MRHVLVSTHDPDLEEALRGLAGPGTTFVLEPGLDDTIERLSRSARIDAVVTDDPSVLAAIREEIPGTLPVYLARQGESATSILAGLDEALSA